MSPSHNSLRSERFPYRLFLNIFPLHAIRFLRFELHLLRLRLIHGGVPSELRNAHDLLVNVGCGSMGLPGWTNIDCYKADGVILVRDCRTTLPLPNDSARAIFTEHFVEHLDYDDEVPLFLKECLRVLSASAVLRIIVPDGEKYLHAYCSDGWKDMDFSPLVHRTSVDNNKQFKTKMEIVNAHFRQGGQHKFSYDYDTLSRLLSDVGFIGIVRRSFRSSVIPELEIDTASRADESLIVEAIAP